MPPFAGRPNAALLEESRDAASRTADERPAVKMRNACGLDSPFGILLRAAPGKATSEESFAPLAKCRRSPLAPRRKIMHASIGTHRFSGCRMPRLLALGVAALCWSADAAFAAKPTKIFLHPASDVIVAGGHAFGSGGAYEKVRGTVGFQIDPTDPRNAVITDLNLAPRNADGLVSFDADYMLLYPADLSKWNHQLVSEINNRGSLLLFLSFANSPFNNDPTTQADFGNGFFLNQGFAMAWVGWGADVQPGGGGLTLRVPAPRHPDGTRVTQKITIELADEFSFPEGGTASCVPLSGAAVVTVYAAV